MRIVSSLFVLSLLSSMVAADPMPPRMRIKEERLRKMAADRKRASEKPFEFTAPEGFTVTEPAETRPAEAKPAEAKPTEAKPEPTPDFAATSVSPAATMKVIVEQGAVTIDDAFLGDQAKKVSDRYVAAHSGGSAKVVKKEIVKLDATQAIRVVLETKADAKKATKPMREVHCVVGNGASHAHITYTTAASSFAKLEKKLDESLRKTKLLSVAAPAPAATPAAN